MKRQTQKIVIIGVGSIGFNMIGRITDSLLKENKEIIIVQAREQFDNKCFEIPSLQLNRINEMPALIELYDKKGKPLELPKSKFHK